MDNTKFDSIFLDILSSCGRPEIFIDSVFSFLQRRTDFFKVLGKSKGNIGMPQGYAAKVASGLFTKYQRIEESSLDKEQMARQDADVASEVEVVSVGEEEAEMREVGDRVIVNLPGNSSPSCRSMPSSLAQTSADTFNGADCGSYKWSQQQTEIDIKIPITEEHKMVKVSCTRDNLRATARRDGEEVVLLDGRLLKPVKDSETVWTVAKGEYIHVSLEKCAEHWWESLFMDGHKIDLGKLEITKDYADLDDEAKCKIEEMTRAQAPKQGTSTRNIEMLKKAWDAEGSPFKGTPFDPSTVNFTENT